MEKGEVNHHIMKMGVMVAMPLPHRRGLPGPQPVARCRGHSARKSEDSRGGRNIPLIGPDMLGDKCTSPPCRKKAVQLQKRNEKMEKAGGQITCVILWFNIGYRG